MINFKGILFQHFHIGIEIRRQINLIDYADIGFGEDMRVFQRLVVAFGRTNDDYFFGFAQVEHGGTYQVADIFDKQDRAGCRRQMLDGMVHHIGFQMAAGAGVHLEYGNIEGCDAVGIVRGLLVALDNIQ